MTKNPISELAVRRAAAGDELATAALFRALSAQFERVASSYESEKRDPHEAQDLLTSAFLRTLKQLRAGFVWQSEGHLCAYYKRALSSSRTDAYRRRRAEVEWTQNHVLPTNTVDENGHASERVEHLADPRGDREDLLRGGEEAGKPADALRGLEQSLGPRDLAFLSAYANLAATPGSGQWPAHERTRFIKAQVGLDGNAFYVAHSRFRQRAEEAAAQAGLRLR